MFLASLSLRPQVFQHQPLSHHYSILGHDDDDDDVPILYVLENWCLPLFELVVVICISCLESKVGVLSRVFLEL